MGKESFCRFLSGDFCSDQKKGIISSYPMKGTIDATLPDAVQPLDERRERSGGTCYDCGSDQE